MNRFDIAVLGAGMQGCAAGYDLALRPWARQIRFLDASESTAQAAAARVNRLCGMGIAIGSQVDASNIGDLCRALDGTHGVLSALPYFLNPNAVEASIAVGAHFCDLGGNTDLVRSELAWGPHAAKKGVCLIPDCGLAPGLANQLAAHLMENMDSPRRVHLRCGGLPIVPRPPMNYRLAFSVSGLVNEYLGHAAFIRGGKIVSVPTLTEDEIIELPQPLGKMEASVTSGGTSLAPWNFLGRLDEYDYKTIRYPGHFAQVRLLRDLGLLDSETRHVDGIQIAPRSVTESLLRERLAFPSDRDLVVLRVTCEGTHRGAPAKREAWLLDHGCETTGFTAMERTTAFPAAAVLEDAVLGRIPPGAHTPEMVAFSSAYFDRLRERGLDIRQSLTP